MIFPASMPGRSRRPRRLSRLGSSTVEFMLFMFVFVPILLYALYITDALFDWLKAQEAVGAAAWEFSGELLHDYSSSYDHTSKYATAISNVSKVKTRYQGLDGWDSAAPTTRVTPATSGQLQTLTCQQVSTPAEPMSTAVTGTLGNDLHTGGMIQCQSSVSIGNVYFGGKPIEHYMDGTSNHWGATVALYSTRMLSAVTLCGVGTPKSGSCSNSAGFTMLTDDWGLSEDSTTTSDNDQQKNEPDQSTVNPHFYALGQVAYKALNPTPTTWTTLDAPIDPPTIDSKFDQFILSYEAETSSGPGTGPTIKSSPALTYAEENSAWDQTSETFPMHHGAISPQPAANATYTADNGDPRTEHYLALPP